MREIHYSEIATFLRCRRQWKYRYHDGLVPRVQHERLDLGTAGHKYLEPRWSGGSDADGRKAAAEYLVGQIKKAGEMAPMSEEEAWETASMISDCAQEAYNAVGGTTVRPVLMAGQPLVEQVVKVEIAPGLLVRGTADEVLEWPDGLRLVVDNKFRKSFRPYSTEPLNLQMATYQALLLRNGVETHGSMQLQINSAPPKVPGLNQDGSVRRAACATTWEIYSETVRQTGGNPADYEDMRAKLKYRAVDMSVRAYRSRLELENFWEYEILPAALTIGRAYGERQGTGGRCFAHEICTSCEMRELCVEDLKGGDTEYVKIANYRHKDEPADQLPPAFEFEDDDDRPTED